MDTTDLAIDLLRIDADTQSRIAIDQDVVADYAELIEQSKDWPFPPVDVFADGTPDNYMMADGFHRYLAGQRAKRASIPCRIHAGTAFDARVFAMTANDKHGLRMTRKDKRACVEWLLDNGGKLSQKAIAEKAGVTTRTVRAIVAERNATPIAAKEPPPDEQRKISAFTSNGGAPEDQEQTVPDTSFPVADEEESEPKKPNKPNGKPISTPPKQYERSHWKQQYDQSIGPLVRLVDKIANNIGEADCESHRTVQEHLNIASEEMTDWMGRK